jgi:hypothetical protein
MDSKWIAWRMSLLAAFILSMMVNINYGASLVSSLLSTPVKTIHTTRDLIDSSLQFAAEDISYSVPYFAVSQNALLPHTFCLIMSRHQIRRRIRSINRFPTSSPSHHTPTFGNTFLHDGYERFISSTPPSPIRHTFQYMF